MKPLEHYRFAHALRPFSLVVGLVGAILGGLIALQEGFGSYNLLALIVVGAVLSQAGINLVNDLEDLGLFAGKLPEQARKAIRVNAAVGFVCFAVALMIGVFFVVREGWPLFWLVLFNALLALNYNLGPINFKRRGLALLQVFVQMGVMLVLGAYMAMGGEPEWKVVWLSLPVSVLVSLLLLSNELRDFSKDAKNGLNTLSVRVGYARAVRLFWVMTGLAFAIAVVLFVSGILAQIAWLFVPLLLLPPFVGLLYAEDRDRLTPLTGRFFMVFGLAYLACV